MTDIPPLALPLPDGLGHHETLIVMWIGSDLPLLDDVRFLAEEPSLVAPELNVALHVCDLLYDLDMVIQMLKHDPDKAARLRSSVSLRALRDIDTEGWARIRTALLAGTERSA